MVPEFRGAALIAAALTVAACSEAPPPDSPAASALAAPASDAAEAPLAADGPALYVFDCGRIRLPTVVDFGLEDAQTDVRELFVPCYLIRHADGDLLWDAGLPPVYAADGQWVDDDTGAGHRLDAPISAQLETVGLAPADIEYVAFSHFHYDHVGDANAFAASTLLIQRPEAEAAFGDDPGTAFFYPEFYAALADAPTVTLDGDHDVFGDGTVRIISAPGHTPGHQVLLVDLAETGKVLLSGDLWHFAASRGLRAVPTFNADRDRTLASMDRIEALLESEGATLWLQHSLAFHEGLEWAPAAYR